MTKKRIHMILQEALEEEIPSSQIQLWPAVKAGVDPGKIQLHPQEPKRNTAKPHRQLRLALAIALITALLAVALMTPQGRTFAQNIYAFFTKAESTSFLLQPSQIAEQPDSPVFTALPPAPYISVVEAEAQIGFDAAELPFVPQGLDYLGVRLYGNTINIEYETADKGGHLMIKQSQEGFVQSEWDQVPVEAIVPVKIGDLDAEFVQGTFVVYPGEASATWNPNMAMLRLRWQQDGIWFEMAKYGNVEAIEYLDQIELIKLAESLSVQR